MLVKCLTAVMTQGQRRRKLNYLQQAVSLSVEIPSTKSWKHFCKNMLETTLSFDFHNKRNLVIYSKTISMRTKRLILILFYRYITTKFYWVITDSLQIKCTTFLHPGFLKVANIHTLNLQWYLIMQIVLFLTFNTMSTIVWPQTKFQSFPFYRGARRRNVHLKTWPNKTKYVSMAGYR